MFNWDVVIFGGSPAGLMAVLCFSRASRRTIVLDKEGLGEYIKNVEWEKTIRAIPIVYQAPILLWRW